MSCSEEEKEAPDETVALSDPTLLNRRHLFKKYTPYTVMPF